MDRTDTLEMTKEDGAIPESPNNEINNNDDAYEAFQLSEEDEEQDETGKRFVYLTKQALKAAEENRFDDSVAILSMIADEDPDDIEIKVMLARAYGITDHPVKAIENWKQLCTMEPSSAYFSFELAKAYHDRDWNKKALGQFEHTLTLDPDNAPAICYIVEILLTDFKLDLAKERCFKEIKRLKGKGIENVDLYSQAFFISLLCQTGTEEEYFKHVSDIIRKSEPDEFDDELIDLLVMITGVERYEFLPKIRELIDMCPDVSEELMAMVASVEIKGKIKALEEDYPEQVCALINHIYEDCDCEDCQDDTLALECCILADINGYLPHLKRLALEQSDLYAIYSSFFDELMSGIDTKLLLKRRVKMLDERELEPVLFRADGSELDFSLVGTDGSVATPVLSIDTFRRNGPKIGRNNPCPCGSGKKHKRCHGS